jgi:flagellin
MISLSAFKDTSMLASSHLEITKTNLQKSLNRLSSGLKINSSVDNPGGLAVASRLNTQVVQSSILKNNLANLSSFLEVQNAHLSQLGEIYRERMGIEIRLKDSVLTSEQQEIYRNKDAMLYERILQIKDATFNGIRLFAVEDEDLSVNLDTGLVNGALENVKQFPLFTKNDAEPVELLFLMDYSGSMGDDIANVKNNVASFISAIQTKLSASSWNAKAVGYRANGATYHQFLAPNGGAFVTSVASLQNQLQAIETAVGGGNTPGESLIQGINDALNVNGGWLHSNSKKVLMAFTDERADPPLAGGATVSSVVSQLQANDVNFWLFTNFPNGGGSDTYTPQLISQSNGNTATLANANTNMSAALNQIVDSLITTELVDYDMIADYVARNNAKQEAVKNLMQSSDMYRIATSSALSQIQDVDVARESINKARLDILQNAGTSMLAQANLSSQSLLRLLI